MKLFGLYSEKFECLMALGVSSNSSEELTYFLTGYINNGYDALWVTADKEHAERVAKDPNVPWYNSCYRAPEWREHDWGKLIAVDLSTFEPPKK